MRVATSLLTVQVSSVHHQMPARHDIGQVALLVPVVLVLAVAGRQAWVEHRLRSTLVRATGRVVGRIEDDGRCALTVVEFAVSGSRYHLPILTQWGPVSRSRLREGRLLTVFYERSDPSQAVLAPTWSAAPWAAAALVLLLAGAVLLT